MSNISKMVTDVMLHCSDTRSIEHNYFLLSFYAFLTVWLWSMSVGSLSFTSDD